MSLLPVGLGAGDASYDIPKSLRFRASADAHLSRNLSGSSTTTWTVSFWFKSGLVSASQAAPSLFYSVETTGLARQLGISGNDPGSVHRVSFLKYEPVGGYSMRKIPTMVFRDPSAWYHGVFVWNTTSGTAEDRAQIWINGTRITDWSVNTNPALNEAWIWNVFTNNFIGAQNRNNGTVLSPFDGYLSEINFIDGQALTPSSFGETDSNGVWVAKKYSGTYGTNGFYLPFNDGTNLTELTKDRSGNANNWTATNVSLTAGATYDWMDDTPTNNFAVLNPLGISGSGTLSEANLKHTRSFAYMQSTFPVSSGSWYWEVTLNALGSAGLELGILDILTGANQISVSTAGYGYDAKQGRRWVATALTTGITTSTVNDIVGFAFDASAGTLQVLKNNTSLFTITGITTREYYPTVNAAGSFSTDIVTFNFGQRPFAYTPPTGFLPLCTRNLPPAAIENPREHFDVRTRTGTGSSTSITGLQFSPDFVWIKNRAIASDHYLYDRIRGAGNGLYSNLTSAEIFEANQLTAFTSDGYSVSTGGATNGNTNNLVDWVWKANGAGVTNTAGTITSTVSANTTAGFSIATFTSPASGNFTVGHGLGIAPKLVIVKRRSGGIGGWAVYHANGTTIDQYLPLNLTDQVLSAPGIWGGAAPTSTVVSMLSSLAIAASADGVMYSFAEIPGFSRIGSYTGNGSADGPFVYTGFRPRWVMVKRTDTTGNWTVYDTARDDRNFMFLELVPNSSAEENSVSLNIISQFDFLSNGFKLRQNEAQANASGGTYIFLAISEHPFQSARAR